MKIGLLMTLCVGVGWIVGVMIMMIFLPLSGTLDYSFTEAMGTLLVFGFPGFILLMISLILSLADGANDGLY